MTVNNEIGVKQPIAEIGEYCGWTLMLAHHWDPYDLGGRLREKEVQRYPVYGIAVERD